MSIGAVSISLVKSLEESNANQNSSTNRRNKNLNISRSAKFQLRLKRGHTIFRRNI